MEFNEYQSQARSTALYPERLRRMFPAPDGADRPRVELFYSAAGLCDESGEVAGKIKKWLRGDLGDVPHPDVDEIRKELGDVLWYIAAICSDLDISLDSVAKANVEKLASRRARGVIRGDGDNR